MKMRNCKKCGDIFFLEQNVSKGSKVCPKHKTSKYLSPLKRYAVKKYKYKCSRCNKSYYREKPYQKYYNKNTISCKDCYLNKGNKTAAPLTYGEQVLGLEHSVPMVVNAEPMCSGKKIVALNEV